MEHRAPRRVVDLDWRMQDGRAALEVRNTGPAFRLVWAQARGDATGRVVVEREVPSGTTRLETP